MIEADKQQEKRRGITPRLTLNIASLPKIPYGNCGNPAFFSLRRKGVLFCHCEARSAAAIRWNNGRSICSVLFQWDRHACARDDTFYPLSALRATSPEGGSVLLSLRGSEATKQSPGRVEVYGVYVPYFFGGIAAVAFTLFNDKG